LAARPSANLKAGPGRCGSGAVLSNDAHTNRRERRAQCVSKLIGSPAEPSVLWRIVEHDVARANHQIHSLPFVRSSRNTNARGARAARTVLSGSADATRKQMSVDFQNARRPPAQPLPLKSGISARPAGSSYKTLHQFRGTRKGAQSDWSSRSFCSAGGRFCAGFRPPG
jgi:hypothetical protein